MKELNLNDMSHVSGGVTAIQAGVSAGLGQLVLEYLGYMALGVGAAVLVIGGAFYLYYQSTTENTNDK